MTKKTEPKAKPEYGKHESLSKVAPEAETNPFEPEAEPETPEPETEMKYGLRVSKR